MKAFENGVMNTANDITKNVSGVLLDNENKPMLQNPGLLVTPIGLSDSKVYAGRKNSDAYNMRLATADDHEVYVCDPHAVASVSGLAGTYNMGAQTLGVPMPEGELCCYVRLDNYDTGKWGDENFSATITTEKYATVAAGYWVPTATKPTGGIFFEIAFPEPFAEAMNNNGSGYYGKVFVLPKVVTTP